jgi:hypothetical protein
LIIAILVFSWQGRWLKRWCARGIGPEVGCPLLRFRSKTESAISLLGPLA